MSARPILEICALRKQFGGIVANDGITLDVAPGSIVGVIGPNGSGKTTLFNAIARVHRVDSGTVRFEGRDLAPLGPSQVARLGIARTYQQAQTYDRLTAAENLLVSVARSGERLHALFHRRDPAAAARGKELLGFVGLTAKADQPAAQLSYGERKLLELAMALMSQPRLLLLDEPTAGINPAMIDHLVERIRTAARTFGLTLLIIEHNMRVVMDLADQVHCLAHGKLLASGTPAQIRSDSRVVEAYLGAR